MIFESMLKVRGPDSKGGALISIGRESIYICREDLALFVKSIKATSEGKYFYIDKDMKEEITEIGPNMFFPAFFFVEKEGKFDEVKKEY